MKSWTSTGYSSNSTGSSVTSSQFSPFIAADSRFAAGFGLVIINSLMAFAFPSFLPLHQNLVEMSVGIISA